ncbi:MAG: hypothetical protein WC264_03335 [Candidatus Paceibacterota bacterium]|jgi:hypothetical protein
MINLIPIEEKKKMSRDFHFRLVALFLWTLGLSVLIASVAIIPSYFLVAEKANWENQRFETFKKEPVLKIDQQTMQIITDLNNKLGLIESAKQKKFLVSQKVIGEIIFKKMSDIKINKFSYESNPIKSKKINIRGIAPNRERLLLFRQTLEDNPAFSEVDLPISNFIKGTNIEFYLSLMPS